MPFRESLLFRMQRGSDFQTFADGLTVLVNDRSSIRPDASRAFAGRYREALTVDLPPEVTPPGIPIVVKPSPSLVGMTLYLQRTCRARTVTLHVVDRVTLPSDGSCAAPELLGGDPTQACAPDKSASPGNGTGESHIAFTSLSNGKLDEEVASERLNAGCFDVYLADPRDRKTGDPQTPLPCRGHLRGRFSFFFERGRPAQPFP